jgi:hypothetical protein
MSVHTECCGRCVKCEYYMREKPKVLEPVPPGLCNRCRTPVPKKRRYCDPCRAELRRRAWSVSQTRRRRVISGVCPFRPAENGLQHIAGAVLPSVELGALC